MKNYQRKLVIYITITAALPAFSEQGNWEEDFSHNDPGLYTNMNGQPDNLSIIDGVAYFSGVGGAYYARQDLKTPLVDGEIPDSALHGYYEPGLPQGVGSVGFGWFSPSLNQGISIFCNRETGQMSTLRHDGWNSAVVLKTNNFGTFFDSAALICFPQPFDYDAWVTETFSSKGHGGAIFNPVHSLKMQSDMFFFMYGSEGARGPGGLAHVRGEALPEPSSFVAIGAGMALLWWRRRKIVKG
jgi:hypothetical protein